MSKTKEVQKEIVEQVQINKGFAGDFAHGSQAVYRHPVTHYKVVKKHLINKNSETEKLVEKFKGTINNVNALTRARERANILARANNFVRFENSNKVLLTL